MLVGFLITSNFLQKTPNPQIHLAHVQSIVNFDRFSSQDTYPIVYVHGLPPPLILLSLLVVYYVYPRKCQFRSFRSSSFLLLALGLLRLYSAAFYAAYSVLNAPCFGWASRGVSRCPLIICSHQESTVNLFLGTWGEIHWNLDVCFLQVWWDEFRSKPGIPRMRFMPRAPQILKRFEESRASLICFAVFAQIVRLSAKQAGSWKKRLSTKIFHHSHHVWPASFKHTEAPTPTEPQVKRAHFRCHSCWRPGWMPHHTRFLFGIKNTAKPGFFRVWDVFVVSGMKNYLGPEV